MKVDEAEKLVCPFMATDISEYGLTYCVTTKCMAWKFEKTYQTYKDTSDEHKFCYPDNAVDKLGYNSDDILIWSVYTDEGYCQRISNESR